MTTGLLARFFACCRERGERTALIDARGTLSFTELERCAQRVALRLMRQTPHCSSVGLYAPADRQWVIGLWGILLTGACAVPLSPLYPHAARQALCSQARLDAVLSVSPWLEAARAAAPQGAAVLALEDLLADQDPMLESVAASRALAPICQPSQQAFGQTAALLLFTSGTTAGPKGVPLSHGNVDAMLTQLQAAWALDSTDQLLHALPLHHLHGICVALLGVLLAGGSVHLLPNFDPEAVGQALEHSNVFMAVPTMYRKLLDHYDGLSASEQQRLRAALGRQRLLTSGSAPLSVSLGQRIAVLADQYPLERYGMTETGIIASNPLYGARVPGSCGQALPGVQLKIVNDEGQEVAAGEAGEVWVKGESVFAGYWQDPANTSKAFTDGWFRTGDWARWEAGAGALPAHTGCVLQLLGRRSVDILKSGGYKVSALQVEEVFRKHAAIGDVAVVGLDDETWGQRLAAGVVLKPGMHATPRELIAWARTELAPYQVPRTVQLLSDLPRNFLGKVSKPELAEQLRTNVVGCKTS